jgi:hypothetical protein
MRSAAAEKRSPRSEPLAVAHGELLALRRQLAVGQPRPAE